MKTKTITWSFYLFLLIIVVCDATDKIGANVKIAIMESKDRIGSSNKAAKDVQTGYILSTFYRTTDCSGLVEMALGYSVNKCIYIGDEQYIIWSNKADNSVSVQYYKDSICLQPLLQQKNVSLRGCSVFVDDDDSHEKPASIQFTYVPNLLDPSIPNGYFSA